MTCDGGLTFFFFFFFGSGPSHASNPLGWLAPSAWIAPTRCGSTDTKARKRHDPYLLAQARQRKAANQSRQQRLARRREASLGDPVKSYPTEFIKELEATRTGQVGLSSGNQHTNYFLTEGDISTIYKQTYELTAPLENPQRFIADPQAAEVEEGATPSENSERATADPQAEKEAKIKHDEENANAREAVNRIVNLANGNTKDRVRINVQKCISTFGRHNTDNFLSGKPTSKAIGPTKTPRVGPDTGSSEVQIAILTEKISNLSRHLESTSPKDKHNKRNLRLLVHKRQKLLKYLRRKERGGPRWNYVRELLGLSDATWKGEISM